MWRKGLCCLSGPDITHVHCKVINMSVVMWQPKLCRLWSQNSPKLASASKRVIVQKSGVNITVFFTWYQNLFCLCVDNEEYKAFFVFWKKHIVNFYCTTTYFCYTYYALNCNCCAVSLFIHWYTKLYYTYKYQ